MKRVGILGLPQSGKTTVFEILMQGAAVAAGSREHVGMVRVPDERIDQLARLYQPKKVTYTQIQFVDSAAAGQGGRAKGADLFASVRTADLIVAVVRDFESAAEGAADPARDLRALEVELILNDLGIVETRIERIEKELRVGKKQGEREHGLLVRCRGFLEAERPLRAESFDAEETRVLRGFQLLSLKPLLAVYNQDEGSTHTPPGPAPEFRAVALRAHLEREIVSLPPEDRPAFRAEMGIVEDGLTVLIRAGYELLGLISFFTVGPDEVRAWTIRRGTNARKAAGRIHSDLERGFIRAEVIPYAVFMEHGSEQAVKNAGRLQVEGKDYVVSDGDILHVRFNV